MISRFTEDPTVALVYRLLRDHVQPGDLENILRDLSDGATGAAVHLNGYQLSNGFLADYAKDIIERLDEMRSLVVRGNASKIPK